LKENTDDVFNLYTLNANFTVERHAGSDIFAHRVGRTIIITGYLNSINDLAYGVTLAQIKVSNIMRVYTSPNQAESLNPCRLALDDGNNGVSVITSESQIKKGTYISFTFVTFINN
jgi:hypothetical protein